MMSYQLLKTIHVSCALITLCLFCLRGYWMLRRSPRLNQRWVKVVPHLVDTTLLLSAGGLVWTLHQYPFVNAWLTAKLLGVLVYIALGTVALKRGRTRRIRTFALVLALCTFGYIVAVAFTKTPTPWMKVDRRYQSKGIPNLRNPAAKSELDS